MCGKKEVARAPARRVCAALRRRGLQKSSAGRSVLAQAGCATARAGNAGLWSPEEGRRESFRRLGAERTVRALGAQAVQVHQVMAYGAVARTSASGGRRAAGESGRRAACHAPHQLPLRCTLLVKQQVRTHPHRCAPKGTEGQSTACELLASGNFRCACARSAARLFDPPPRAPARRRTRTRCRRLATDSDRASSAAPASVSALSAPRPSARPPLPVFALHRWLLEASRQPPPPLCPRRRCVPWRSRGATARKRCASWRTSCRMRVAGCAT